MTIRRDDKLLCFEYLLEAGSTTEEALAMVGEGGEKLLGFWQSDERITPGALFSLNLAYEELASNVARHSLGGSMTSICIRCESVINDVEVQLLLCDGGQQFDPTAADATAQDGQDIASRWTHEHQSLGGVGLVLMRTMFPNMRYEYRNGYNRIHVAVPLSS